MIGDQKQRDDGFVTVATKVPPHVAELLNIIAASKGTDIYGLLQLFIEVIISAAKTTTHVSPKMKLLLHMLEVDAGWNNAFNFANPTAQMDIAQMILILQQHDGKRPREGFGMVMIDKPFMGKAPEKVDDIDPHRNNPQMTENVDYILERVTEVTMQGIYRRLRLVGGMMKCNNLSDVLLDLIERQSKELREEDDRIQMQGEAQFSESGKRIEYGKRTKAKHHRTPDGEANRQKRIVFSDDDREAADAEVKRESRDNEEPDFKPFGIEW